jgi:hypothetical protein
MKNILLIMSVLILSCASSVPSNKFSIVGETFFVKEVVVNLSQKCSQHGFRDAEELEEKFKSDIEGLLSEQGLLAVGEEQAIGLTLAINYKREFLGEAFGACKSYGVSRFSYSSNFLRDNTVVANYSQREVIPNHGTFGNIATIAKQLSNTGGEALEEKNLSIFSNLVVKNLSSYHAVILTK